MLRRARTQRPEVQELERVEGERAARPRLDNDGPITEAHV
jgi:hypothetical protein